ncbi:MAG: cell envelope biogenesis protein TolA [Proteobacteria bacterium]|nr:cell envelope biogenesis protein TolA [Pseudomonadota bacterium]MBS0573957.1 cell envelope biogenesis protein TolA [Pseudomonadota bacterium]
MGRGWLPQDRAERIGLIVSGIGHLALILWALLGGIFFPPEATPPVTMTNVSLMSSDQFAALQAKAPTAPKESPAKPSAPKASEKPPAKPEKKPEPKPPEPKPPEPQPQPDAAPEAPDQPPVEAQATDVPPTPTPAPKPDQLVAVDPTQNPEANPKSAPKVAPTPTETPAPDAQVSDTVTEQTTDQPSDQKPKDKPKDQSAPADAGQVLETEANKADKTIGGAPPTSAVPKPRPKKAPAPAAEPAPADQTQTASAATADAATADAVDSALADALSGAASDTPSPGTGTAASGPPLTSGEKDAMVVAVKDCWNVGSLSTDALRTIVTIGFSMSQDGKPDPGSIHMVGSEGGTDASAQQAYEAGRRAILRCQHDGYPLPADKYDQWKDIEIVFNPAKMRMR